MAHQNTLAILQELRNPTHMGVQELKTETVRFFGVLTRAQQESLALRSALELANFTEPDEKIRSRFEVLNQKIGALDFNISNARKYVGDLLLTMENMKNAEDSIGAAAEQ